MLFQLIFYLIHSVNAQSINEVNIPLDDICSEYETILKIKEIESQNSRCSLKESTQKNLNDSILDFAKIINNIQPKIPENNDDNTQKTLCENYKKFKLESNGKSSEVLIEVNEKDQSDVKKAKPATKWIYRIQFGPGYSKYSNSDLVIDSPHLKGTIKDVHFDHRGSYAFYNLAENLRDPDKSIMQVIDEPTNNFVFEAEKKDKFIIGLKLYHPKMTARGTDKDFGPDIKSNPNNSNLDVNLDVEGKHDQGKRDLINYFWFFELTKRLYHADVYFNKVIPIVSKARKSKWGSVNFSTGVSAGLYGGYEKNAFMPNPSVSDHDGKNKWALIGYSVGTNQKLTYTLPNERYEIAVQHDLSVSSFKFDMLDGVAKIPKMYTETFSLVLGVNLNTGTRKEKPVD